jgi:LCP family protein required for cell wall assembly
MPEERQFKRLNHKQAKANRPGQPPLSPEASYNHAQHSFSQSTPPPQHPGTLQTGKASRSRYSHFVTSQARIPISEQETLQMQPAFTPPEYHKHPARPLPPVQSPVPPEQFQQRPENRLHNRKPRKRKVPIWARVVLSILLFLLVAAGSVAAYLYFTFSGPLSHIVGQQVPRLKGEVDPNQGHTGGILDNGRFNILLLGSDTDYKTLKINGGALAQADIVVTIDPATKSVGMLSIPRDFWVNVPGYGMHKLDEAYLYGGGGKNGIALSRLTIEQDFGIPINYSAWVGLDGFVKVIDTVGGVDIDVLHPITDDTYPDDVGNTTGDPYAVKRLYMAPGPHHLTGIQALEYVRSRHADLQGDFGRSARQQQVLSALKTKLYNPDIVGKLPSLANDLDGYVKTDMQLDKVITLMNFARSVDQNKISRVILGPPYSKTDQLSDGTSIVTPFCDKIIPEIAHIFALGNKARCNIQANSASNTVSIASTSQMPLSMSEGKLSGINDVQQMLGKTSGLVSGSDLFGIHSLLDLMLMVVLDLQPGWQT